MSAPRARVVGIGHDARGDDALGLLVVRRLREDLRLAALDVDICEHNGDGLDLALLLEGPDTVLLVDAVVSDEHGAGTILRLDAGAAPLPARLFAPHSTHLLGVAEAVEFARVTERLPARVLLLGLVAAAFDFGAPPTRRVAAALPEMVECVLQELLLSCPTDKVVR